ncbi:hypothetical protein FRZ03_38440 [Streptomyces misionensis]|uniref:Lipoprotein n=1 Tax=Streptomyces misionensis TaxID=67331 RepID=A0A5C6IB12_9ACTN|nr:hypothetical protein FRZ03_38440 [Streptomyces misionensis]
MRLCAAVAVSALSFALVTGCSGESSDSSSAAKGKSPEKALSAAELKKLVVTGDELPGFDVGPVKQAKAKRITTDNADCRPLTRVLSGLPPADAQASTDQLATEKAKKRPSGKPTSLEDLDENKFEGELQKSLDRDVTTVTLASYDGGGAEQALKAVSAAVKACAGGFVGEQAGTKVKFTKVTEEKAAGGGDGSVAFAAFSETDGDVAPVYGEVDRHGSTLSGYFTVNLGSMMAKKAYAVTPAVVKAQEARLT